MGKLSKKIIEDNDILIITADHGNGERMMNPLTAQPTTGHDLSPVPIYVVAKELFRNKTKMMIDGSESETIGILCDVAPTILNFMGIPKPKDMTGQDLMPLLK